MPEKLVIACPANCSFHPDKIGAGLAETLMLIRANGAGSPTFSRRAAELLRHPVAQSSVERHLKHYREPSDADEPKLDPKNRLGDLEILDLVIQRGAANSQNWKPSIKDTIEAMKLKMQLTGNSVFDDFMKLFDSDEVDEVLAEADEAILAADERPDPEEPLEDPVL